MMRIVPIPAFKDNYIWALVAESRVLVVDPGEASPVAAFLDQSNCRLSGILLTHHHADHIGGVSDLLATWDVPVFGPADPRMPMVTRVVTEGERFALAPFAGELSVLAVPGHTDSHIAYRLGTRLFCGDTLFSAGCGRLLGGTAPELFASLTRLAALPDDTEVYCTHEYTLANLRFAQAADPANPDVLARQQECEALRARGLPTLPARLAAERTYNPFLRCTTPAVRQSVEAHAEQPLDSPLAVFTALRQWKDVF